MNEYILYYIRCIRRSKFELRIDINAMAMFIYLTSMIRCYHRKRAKTMIYRTEGGTIALWKFTGGAVPPPPPLAPPWLRACVNYCFNLKKMSFMDFFLSFNLIGLTSFCHSILIDLLLSVVHY